MAHANENPTGTKGHHEFVPASAAKDPLAKTGYVEKDYEHKEYPKHVGTNDEGQPVVVKSEAEEKAFLAKKKNAAKAAE